MGLTAGVISDFQRQDNTKFAVNIVVYSMT